MMLLVAAALMAAALMAVGCGTPGGGAAVNGNAGNGRGGDRGGGVADSGYWEPRPMSMRVYPSTRYLLDGGEPLLEAAVEFADEMGHPVKAGGTLRLELLNVLPEREPEQRLFVWEISLATLADQQQHYNPVLRAYQFRLAVNDMRVRRVQTRLRVTFIGADGRLSAEQVFEPVGRE